MPKFHCVTSKNKFDEWSKKGIFKKVFEKYKNLDINTYFIL
jgi:hypothetical protein